MPISNVFSAAADPDRLFARRGGVAVSVRQFRAEVAGLAAALPAQPYVVNLCEDRYLFAVALAAALVRGQVTLLPPDRSARSLRKLDAQFPGARVLLEGDRPSGEGPAGFRIGPELPAEPGGVLPEPAPDQPAVVAFTSGSTGEPQAHRKSWGVLAASAGLIHSALAPALGATLVATVPAQHMYGLELSVLLPLCAGLVLDPVRPFFPADIADVLRAVPAPRVLVATPIHLRVLADAGIELPALDRIVSATAPLDAALAAECEARLGAPVLEIFGCTEAGSIASRRTVEGADWTLFEPVQLRREGDRCRIEADYLAQAVDLADRVEIVDDRHFRLHGRAADLVNIAGKRHSLGALNRILLDIDGVVDGAFFVPEPAEADAMARPVAFVVAPGLTAAALRQRLGEHLDPVFVPRRIVLLDALPRNATGKLPREALAELLRRHGESGAAAGPHPK